MDMELGHSRLILDKCRKHGLLRNQAAYALATARWETAHTMKPVVEAFWLSEDWRQKNLRYYPWHGRGYVQLTWQNNYIRAGKALDVDLISDPDRALEPDIAAEILVLGCRDGWFTGKKLGDYVTIRKSDFVNARRVVNGTDKAQSIAKLAEQYDAALSRERYGVDPIPRIPADDHPREPIPTVGAVVVFAALAAVVAFLALFGFN